MVICFKKQKQCCIQELETGDCWIGLSLADSSGLILAARVGKHTDELIDQLVVNTEGKTNCKRFNSDGWGGYERVLPPEIQHHIGKDRTQRCSYVLTVLCDNKLADGIDGKTSLVRYGNRQKWQLD